VRNASALRLAAVDGDACLGKKPHFAAQLHETGTHFADRRSTWMTPFEAAISALTTFWQIQAQWRDFNTWLKKALRSRD